MRILPFGLLAVAISAVPALAQSDCRYEAERAVTLDAAGARLLELEAGAGSLKVIGKPGLTSIRLHGRACASDKDLLDDIKLEAHRSGSSVVAKANTQEHNFRISWKNQYARLDLVVEVPSGLAANIDDGSGEMELSGLGATDIDDGSGGIIAHDLASAHIDDGSGEINLTDIRGPVEITDGSGEIQLRNVAGPVDIDDGSGEIDVRGVTKGVRITDASGGIDVADVGGDFIVTNDGSGGIDYDNIRGRVDVPRRRHR